MPASGYHTRKVKTGHIALQRFWVQRWLAAFGIESHAQTFNKGEVRVISRQCKHLFRRKSLCLAMLVYNDFVSSNFLDARFQQCLNLSRLDAVFNIRSYPILQGPPQFLPSMHQRNPRAVSVQVQRSFRRGVLPADDHDVLIPEFMWFPIVMRDVRQVFARHSQHVWQIIVTCRESDLLAVITLLRLLLCFRDDRKVSVMALNAQDALVQSQFE